MPDDKAMPENRGRKPIYGLREMNAGDTKDFKMSAKKVEKLYSLTSHYKRRHGIHFMVRRIQKGLYRVKCLFKPEDKK